MDRDNDWILPNRAGFISWARESLSATANETPGLRPPQAIAKFMMNRFTPLRGILLVHSMGTGKTCSAVAALESWIGREEEIETEKRPIVLTKSSLIGDFKKKFMESCRNKYFYNPYSLKENSKWVLLEDISELKPYLRSTVRDDREMFKLPILVPAWFSNVEKEEYIEPRVEDVDLFAELIRRSLSTHVEFVAYNGLTDNNSIDYINPKYYKNRFVVIDEVHYFTGISGEARDNDRILNGVYEAIRDSNAKVLAMTATPVVNNISDIAPLLNLVYGRIVYYEIDTETNITAEEFVESKGLGKIVDYHRTIYPGKHVLELLPYGWEWNDNRDGIVFKGKTSSFGNKTVFESMKMKTGYLFPQKKGDFDKLYLNEDGNIKKEMVSALGELISGLISYYSIDLKSTPNYPEVSQPQRVDVEFSQASIETYIKYRREELRIPGEISTYRPKTRSICNFTPPSGNMSEFEKNPEILGWESLKKVSPKTWKILEHIKTTPGKRHAVYSGLRSKGGIDQIEIALRSNGFWKLERDKKGGIVRTPPYEGVEALNMAFVYIGLEAPIKDADLFNSNDTYEDLTVSVCLLSQNASTGLDLKRVRYFHILEPAWSYVQMKQAWGRAARANSHLGIDDKNLDIFIYVMTFNKKQIESNLTDYGFKETATSDEVVLESSKRKKENIDSIEYLLKRAAIDCGIYDSVKCEESSKDPNDIIKFVI